MDKKKVITLIESARSKVLDIDPTNTELTAKFSKAMNELNQAIKELQKPDWISVEDELPPYDVDVLVTSKEDPDEVYFSRRTKESIVVVDKHEFATYRGSSPITHWRKIKGLI